MSSHRYGRVGMRPMNQGEKSIGLSDIVQKGCRRCTSGPGRVGQKVFKQVETWRGERAAKRDDDLVSVLISAAQKAIEIATVILVIQIAIGRNQGISISRCRRIGSICQIRQ